MRCDTFCAGCHHFLFCDDGMGICTKPKGTYQYLTMLCEDSCEEYEGEVTDDEEVD